MTHISQRMWHDHGPSSLRISLNTHTHARTHTSVSASFIIHQTVWGTAVGWPTMESRRRRWRSRWPSGHTCGTAAPPSCTMKWYFKKMMFQLFWFCSLSNIQITFFILPHLFFFSAPALRLCHISQIKSMEAEHKHALVPNPSHTRAPTYTHRRWLIFQAAVWKSVEVTNRPVRPLP